MNLCSDLGLESDLKWGECKYLAFCKFFIIDISLYYDLSSC